MELGDIANYVRSKYRIEEERRWAEHPELSVLAHPSTGKWIAVLIREGFAQLCDIRCGNMSSLSDSHIFPPFRMKGDEWVGVRLDGDTDPKMICRMIDRAIIYGGQNGCMIFLGSELPANKTGYKDTPLPVRRDMPLPAKADNIPDKIREMRRLYEYGFNSHTLACRNFYVQGKFMEDYEDDYVWSGEFKHYFPTYHDLTTAQLRGYFTWRTNIRKGIYAPTSTSFAYIYIYELLNGIGASSAEDSLEKLAEFERGYIDKLGADGMAIHLHRWMTDLAIVNGLPAETARRYTDRLMLKKDRAYAVLKAYKEHTDDEIYEALSVFSAKLYSSAVIAAYPEEGRHLYAAVWRFAAAQHRSEYSGREKKLFSLCFGERRSTSYEPLKNAVYYPQYSRSDRTYELSETRTYSFKGGKWRIKCYDTRAFDKKLFEGLLHETERQLRIYLGVGSPLKERPDEKWAAPYIEAVIAADREEKRVAEAKKVTIRFDDLDRIRRDALHTQNSLLTEDERTEDALDNTSDNAPDIPDTMPVQTIPVPAQTVPLDPRQRQVIAMLLEGTSVKDIIRSWGCMAEIFAEELNELFFDEIGDTVVECDGDDITLTEDYREDVIRITGGYDK